MKKNIFTFFVLGLTVISCNKKETETTTETTISTDSTEIIANDTLTNVHMVIVHKTR